MSNSMLKVICEGGKIESFKKGIIGAYYWIGHPTDTEEEPEYILRVFFDDNRNFKGILLLEDYQEELKDSFDSLIECEIPRDIKEYEILNIVKIEDNTMKVEDYDLCECSLCGHLSNWEDSDIWECEECGELTCSKCIEEFDNEAKESGVGQLDVIRCKACYEKK